MNEWSNCYMGGWNKLYYGRYIRGIYTEQEFIDAVHINMNGMKFCIIMKPNNPRFDEIILPNNRNLSIEEAVRRHNMYMNLVREGAIKSARFDIAREEQ